MGAARLPLACRVASYRPFEELALPHMAAQGLRGAELHAPPSGQAAGLRRRLGELGLRAVTVQAACDLSSPQALAEFTGQLPTVAELGARHVLIAGRCEADDLDTARRRLGELAEASAAAGVTLLLETHPPLATNAAVTLETFAQVPQAALRLNFDPANIVFYNEGLDALAELRRVLDLVGGVHLKDSDGGYRQRSFPALGEGVLDLAAMISLLKARGFDGPWTIEIEGRPDDPRTQEVVLGRVERSIRYLRERGFSSAA